LISTATISPDPFLYQGTLQAEADVNDPSGVASVAVVASGPSELEAELVEAQPGHYSGTLQLPRNDSGLEHVYEVHIEATDGSGNLQASAAVSVVVDSPPAPPGG
jgi:hypothetical protein